MAKYQADSVLEAAKKVADALGMTWAELHVSYRNLQEEDGDSGFIPKSAGRKIFTAHPNFVTRLLVAVGFSGMRLDDMFEDPDESFSNEGKIANYITYGLSIDGADLPLTDQPSSGVSTSLEDAFARVLSDEAAASALDSIRFNPAEKSIAFHAKDGGVIVYRPASSLWPEDDDVFRTRVRQSLDLDTRSRINRVMEISGEAIETIARTVAWRTSPSPVRFPGASEEN